VQPRADDEKVAIDDEDFLTQPFFLLAHEIPDDLTDLVVDDEIVDEVERGIKIVER